MLATFRKELMITWASPLPWVMGALFHLLWGYLYVNELEARRQALFQPAVPLAAFLLLVIVPVLTMRTLAEERRSGSLDLLLTTRVRPASLVVGKWAATWLSGVILLAPVTAVVVVIERFASFDPGPVLVSLVGLILMAATLTAIGVVVSSCTASLPLAVAGSFLVGLMLWFAGATPSTGDVAALLARVSLSERLATFAAGGFDSADVVFFLVAPLAALLVAATVVGRRRSRQPRAQRLGRILQPVAVAGALLGLAMLTAVADSHRSLTDLTTGHSLTLSDTTRAVVGAVDRSVRVTAFAGRDDPSRVALTTMLGRYQKLNRRIDVDLRDPEAAPGEMRRLGVDPVFGGIVIARGDRTEIALTPTEQAVTSALARVMRDDVPIVCVTTGSGEADITATTGEGLSSLAALVAQVGYRLEAVDLLVGVEVPDRCGALLIAGPSSAAADSVVGLSRWLAAGGRALVLTDPASAVDWVPVLGPYGIGVERGIVFEGDADHRFPDDPTRPIVLTYQTVSPIGRRLGPTFYAGVQGLTTASDAAGGLAVEAVARTTAASYLERNPLTPTFDDGDDLRGPITVVAAADKSRSEGGKVTRTKIVVTADSDLATNAFVNQAGNAQLLLRALDWLLLDEDLVSVTSNLAPVRPLDLTAARLSYLRVLTMGIVPGLFLAIGALGWAVRRVR